MGVYTDLLNNAKSWDSGDDAVATDASITREIRGFMARQGDPDIGPPFSQANEVHTILQFDPLASIGNFTLTLSLLDHDEVTTANIAWDADAATIASSINTAVSAALPGLVDTTVLVSLTTNLNEGDATLTFSGTSLRFKRQGQTEINVVDLDVIPEGVDITTYGQLDRNCWAVINAMGLTPSLGPLPTDSEVYAMSESEWAAVPTRASHSRFPRQETLHALARQIAIEDGSDEFYLATMTIFGLGRLLDEPYTRLHGSAEDEE